MTLAERIAEKLIDITPGVTWTRDERMELLRRVIAAELEERDAKIRRAIFAGMKVACEECCGSGHIKHVFGGHQNLRYNDEMCRYAKAPAKSSLRKPKKPLPCWREAMMKITVLEKFLDEVDKTTAVIPDEEGLALGVSSR